MNPHRPFSVLSENLATQFAERGYTQRHVEQAFRLLETFDYDVHVNDWDEKRRFVLFDSLSKVAFSHVIAADQAGQEERTTVLEYALIAQCAMELVCHNKTFSNELLSEMCGEMLEAA